MRILNEDNDVPVSNILLLLTVEEAQELIGKLESSIQRKDESYHGHVDDKEYQHQITCTVYTSDNIIKYHKRIQHLITGDK